MTPGKVALDIYRGDTRSWRISLWLDPAHTEPHDLADVAVAAEIRDAASTLTTLACTVEAPNVVMVDLPADISRTLAVGKGAWDLELTYLDGFVQTVVGGAVKVAQDVTNSELV